MSACIAPPSCTFSKAAHSTLVVLSTASSTLGLFPAGWIISFRPFLLAYIPLTCLPPSLRREYSTYPYISHPFIPKSLRKAGHLVSQGKIRKKKKKEKKVPYFIYLTPQPDKPLPLSRSLLRSFLYLNSAGG